MHMQLFQKQENIRITTNFEVTLSLLFHVLGLKHFCGSRGRRQKQKPTEAKILSKGTFISDCRNIGSKRVGQHPVALLLFSLSSHCMFTDMGTTQHSITNAPASQSGNQSESGRWQRYFYELVVSLQATHAQINPIHQI